MKRNPLRVIPMLIAICLAILPVACTPDNKAKETSKSATEAKAPPAVDETELRLLNQQVEQERQLRGEAETRVATEAGRRERWQTLAVVALLLAVGLFLVGTAIGSKGRRHAESA